MATVMEFKRMVDLGRDYLKEDGQLLPVWILPSGLVGSGDHPQVYERRGAAKLMAGRQARIQGYGTKAFVVERRHGTFSVYQTGDWTGAGALPATSAQQAWANDPHCWKYPPYSEPLVSQWPLWAVTPQPAGPRSRPSGLAERGIAGVS
jgi:hypothetical protein